MRSVPSPPSQYTETGLCAARSLCVCVSQSTQYSMDHFSGMHNWYACSHARPTYCNVCREALSGVTSHGLSCEGTQVHTHIHTHDAEQRAVIVAVRSAVCEQQPVPDQQTWSSVCSTHLHLCTRAVAVRAEVSMQADCILQIKALLQANKGKL